MWNNLSVEKALFAWLPWRRSIINTWCSMPKGFNGYALDDFRKWAAIELKELKMPESYLLEFYWICCVTSDYNIGFSATYEKIEVTPWILKKYDAIMRFAPINYPIGKRWVPPEIWTKKDWERLLDNLGIDHNYKMFLEARKNPTRGFILLPENHAFREVLKGFKGRPAASRKRGRPPKYSDRIAVKCAMLADKLSSEIEVAKEIQHSEHIDMKIHKPYESYQSDIVNHLIERGRTMLRETSSINTS